MPSKTGSYGTTWQLPACRAQYRAKSAPNCLESKCSGMPAIRKWACSSSGEPSNLQNSRICLAAFREFLRHTCRMVAIIFRSIWEDVDCNRIVEVPNNCHVTFWRWKASGKCENLG